MAASLTARAMRICFRGALLAVHLSGAFVLLFVLAWPSVSNAADTPASPAQLQGLRDQISGLQSQQQAAWNQISGLQAQAQQLQAQRDSLRALANRGQKYMGGTTSLGDKVADTGAFAAYAAQRNLSVTSKFDLVVIATQLAADIADADAKVKSVQSQIDRLTGEIDAREKQINQLQANLNYWQNPVGADIGNEKEHLRNLQNEPSPKDEYDQRQRQLDIDNSMRRIKELEDLERQFQQSQPGTQTTTGGPSSGQSVQPQGSSYTAPSTGFGTSGSSAQSPGSQGAYGPGVPPWIAPTGDTSVQVPWEGQVPRPAESGTEGHHHPSGSGGG